MFTSEQDRVEEDSCLHPQHPLSQLEASMNRAFLPFHLTPNQPPPPNCFASAFEMRVPSPHDPQFNPVNFGMRAPQAYHPNQQVQHQYYVNSHGYPTPENSPPAENSVQWNPANQSTYVSYRQDFYSRNIAPLAYINNPELRASNCGPVLPSEKPVIKRRSNRCTCPNCSGPPQQRVGKGKAKKKHNCHFETCEKVYGKTSHLKAHIRWHNGERPFVCPYDNCVKKFTRSDELTRHVRIHTGERKFKCMHCDKGFTRSDHLKKHMKTHNRDPAEVKVRGRKKKTPNPPPSPSASLSSGGATSEASSMSPIHEEKENCENYVPQGHAFHQPGFEYFEEQRGQDLLRFGPQPQEQQFRMHLEPIPIPDIPPRQSHQQMQQHQGQMQMQLQQQEQHFNMNQYNGL